MAKVFLDANYFIGLVNRTPETDTSVLNKNACFISVLSCHILFYVNKVHVPDTTMNDFIKDFNQVELSSAIVNKSLEGPTVDFEDNVQLHSAAETECDIFITLDKKLLALKYFGKVRIQTNL